MPAVVLDGVRWISHRTGASVTPQDPIGTVWRPLGAPPPGEVKVSFAAASHEAAEAPQDPRVADCVGFLEPLDELVVRAPPHARGLVWERLSEVTCPAKAA
jgi:hypothetical protein